MERYIQGIKLCVSFDFSGEITSMKLFPSNYLSQWLTSIQALSEIKNTFSVV